MTTEDLLQVALTGIGATAVLDLWLFALNGLGVATLPMALIGRWIGHAARGRLSHAAIRHAPAMAGERSLGWLFHYAVGVLFAAVLISVAGPGWMRMPTVLPALVVGVSTVVMPLFVMQPAMGGGFAASKTSTPMLNCLRSVLNHTVFGFGLYLSAIAVRAVSV
jgi:hypothetical protein